MFRCGPATNGLPSGDIDRAEVVGFEQAAGDFCQFISQSPQRLEIALRLEQRLRGDDHFLAGIGQVTRQAKPVGNAYLLAARADHLADADDVDRRVLRHFGVELEDFMFGPEIEQRSESEFHRFRLT
jgi:hypothetical protein